MKLYDVRAIVSMQVSAHSAQDAEEKVIEDLTNSYTDVDEIVYVEQAE